MKTLRYLTIFLLFFIGLNALAGGYLLIDDPSGASLHLSIEQVEPATFDNFLVPGILLFVLNGLLSIVTALYVIFRWKGFAAMVFLQGMILTVWMIFQIYYSEQIYLIQYLITAIGAGLVVIAIRFWQLLSDQKQRS
jgi:hypothetical protein